MRIVGSRFQELIQAIVARFPNREMQGSRKGGVAIGGWHFFPLLMYKYLIQFDVVIQATTLRNRKQKFTLFAAY